MITLVSLLFMSMIPIDCKIEKIYIYIIVMIAYRQEEHYKLEAIVLCNICRNEENVLLKCWLI